MNRRHNPFSLTDAINPKTFQGRLLQRFQTPIENILGVSELHRLYDLLPEGLDKREFVQSALEIMRARYEIVVGSLDNIPKEGPVVVVANHPFGGIEGVILADMLNNARPEVKILANWLLGAITEIKDYFIFVDPFGSDKSLRKNIRPMQETIEYLKNGGLLGVFPSGTVSHLHLCRRDVSDPEWSPNVARIIRKTKATVVPVFFEGHNGWVFQLLGLIHPLLRTLRLPRELINKQDFVFRVKIGQPVGPDKLASYDTDEKLLGNLRLRTYLLADYQREKKTLGEKIKSTLPFSPTTKPMEPVVKAEDKLILFDEIEKLSPDCLLIENDEYNVYCAKAKDIPHVLREIGRLRELTFRDASEGTGLSIDLDAYDNYYIHLFVWNTKKHEIVGSYRLGKTDVILRRFGKKGLYTWTLFDYKDSLLEQLGPALELGRSFVRKEYQKSYIGLLLLWKGIGQFVVRNPKYRRLYGLVSISSDYDSLSRRLIITFLKSNNFQPELAKLIRSRNPMKFRNIKGLDAALTSKVVTSMEDVNDLLAEIQKTHKQIPVLLRQYIKMGGTLLGFNVDQNFGSVLDGLLMVDLLKTDRKLMERYFTKPGTASIFEYHRARFPQEVAEIEAKKAERGV